ncbi:MAG TPA: Hpt domain-containing protein, partial [Burkholderiaceae bacterium]|nr:Hpt domain-containing protein [Burkholderiaceae bacterium]
FVATASDASTLEPEIATLRATPVPPPPAAPVPPGATGLEEDDEMREVFLEEAREVMQNAHDAMGVLADAPDNVSELTTVRRAFHTLKGSSRMVGLKDFGEAAWAFEQLYNARLADAPRADAPLMQLTLDALAYLGDWVDALAARRDGGHDAHAVKAAADALRLEGRSTALPLPGQGAVPQPPAAVEPIEIPVAIAIEAPAAEEPIDAPTLVLSQPIALPEPMIELSLDLPSEAPIEAVALDLELAASAAEPVIEPLVPAALPAPEVQEISFELDLRVLDEAPALAAPAAAEPLPELSMPAPVEAAPPVVETMVDAAAEAANDDVDLEQVKVVGELRIGIPLFNIFLNEADEQSRRLSTELAEWALELHRPVGETAVALAHSLAGNSATVGFSDLSQLARSLEHALMRSQAIGFGDDVEARLFVEVGDELRHLLHQFAAGFLKSPPPELLQRLAEHEVAAAHRMERQTAEASDSGAMPLVAPEPPPVAAELPVLTDEAPPADFAPTTGFGHLEELKPLDELPAVETLEAHAEHARPDALDNTDDIDAIDAVDAELFPIFEEEGQELLPQLASQVRDWLRRPGDAAGPTACMRTLHTLKGGARLAGAMRLGEMAHRLETNIEHLLARGDVHAADVETLQMRVDALASAFEALRSSDAQAYADASEQAAEALRAQLTAPTAHAPLAELKPIEAIDPLLREAPPVAEPIAAPTADSVPATTADIDWSRFVGRAPTLANVPLAERATALAAQAAVRVRAPLLDRLVNQAGEVSITRSRIESDVSQLKGSLSDLTENLERLRRQLRDIELQGETQISSRMEAAKAAAQAFDPLEMDRFTRFQELTRMMAESVNDVATVQRSLQRTLQSAEDELAAQARLTRDLQDDLLRTRMVEFEGMSERLYRVVRQAAKETGKHVRLDIVGGSIEIDRGVLDRMTGSFEHLLRNCLTHGIETPEQRTAAGKEPTGLIVVALTHEGNEVAIEFRDDGRGLDLLAVRDKGVAQGLIEAGKEYSDAELADLIFKPGFSTASSVTELAGRGIGMDVVRAEVNAMGGRIETATAIGKGTSFKLVLPLTTAVTQVVMLRCGETTLAVPSTLIEIVRRAKPDEVAQCYASGTYTLGDVALPFFWLGALLQGSGRGTEGGRSLPVVVIRSAAQRIALHVDEVLGNQEVVVKNLGPQLSRLPGLAGMTLLASGAVALIYNPVALATLYGDTARALMIEAQSRPQLAEAGPEALVVQAPLVLVVDDSLTVRRVTQRLLVREGYRVSLAKDGLEALERLAEERPAVLLSDIEMPRMDGFDLVRNVRGDKQLSDLPVIMITSRIAQKHRDVASELGVDHYLGKPYSEEDLLALVSRYAGAAVAV